VEETNDDMFWNGSEEDGDVRRECEEDEGTDCEDGDFYFREFGGLCYIWINAFFLGRGVLFEVRLRLELS
jgi:hypothetical protein